jgi:chitinase
MKKLLLIVLFLLPLFSSAQEKMVAGYFPYYRDISTTDWTGYTHVYFAFAFTTSDGGLSINEEQFEAFVEKADELGIKKYISIATTGMPSMASNELNRENFADTLREFCRAYDLDGIDMDWELIDNEEDSSSFRKLIQEIRLEIDTTNLEFCATIGDGDWNLKWYSNEALEQADWLQIMIYDKTGTWSTSPFGNHATWSHFLAAETYWNDRGFTDDQLVMGVPFYGYRFSSTEGGMAEAVPYEDIVNRFPLIKTSDNYLYDESGYYWFNGQDLIKQKREYVFDNEFKGIFTWEMSQDIEDNDRSLLKPFIGEEYPSDVETGIDVIEGATDWFIIKNSQFQLSDTRVVKVEFFDVLGSKLQFTEGEILPNGQVIIIKGYSDKKIYSSKLLITN